MEFPLLRNPGLRSIPWAMIAPHEAQAMKNHGQTLERLAERQGLSPSEALAVLEDRPFRLMPDAEAKLAALVNAFAGVR